MTKISYIHGVNSLEMPNRISTADIDLTTLNAGELERYGNAEILFALADASTNPAEKQQLIADGNALLLGMGGSLGVQNYLAKQARNTGPGFEFSAVSGVGNILSNAADKIKNALKNLANNLIKKLLPAVGPVFLYLFLPATVGGRTGQKRARVLATFKAISRVTGIKESVVLAALRKGIVQKFGKSPEDVLKGLVAKVNGSAIGSVAIIMAIIGVLPTLFKVIGEIAKARGKKGEIPGLDSSDMPNEDELRQDLTPKGGNQGGGNQGGNDETKTDNTALYIGLAAAAVLLIKK